MYIFSAESLSGCVSNFSDRQVASSLCLSICTTSCLSISTRTTARLNFSPPIQASITLYKQITPILSYYNESHYTLAQRQQRLKPCDTAILDNTPNPSASAPNQAALLRGQHGDAMTSEWFVSWGQLAWVLVRCGSLLVVWCGWSIEKSVETSEL